MTRLRISRRDIGLGDIEKYQAIAEMSGVGDRCFWVGAVKNTELPLWYSWCDCMCTPSRWEGFGIVFIEAAACGAAIVTSDIGPMNEYLTPESACLVEDFENPSALAVAIRRSCEDTDHRSLNYSGSILAMRKSSVSVLRSDSRKRLNSAGVSPITT